MKRWLIVLALFALAPVLSAIDVNGMDKVSTESETMGVIVSHQDNFLHVIGEPLTESALDDVVIIVGDAPIYDMLTGFPVDISAIIEGMYARIAYYQQPSEPHMALAIWLNYCHKDAAVFAVAVSENIQYIDDSCIFLSVDGKFRIVLAPDTAIIDPCHGYIKPTDIYPGQKMFVWVDMVTASSPALAYPDKVVLIH